MSRARASFDRSSREAANTETLPDYRQKLDFFLTDLAIGCGHIT